MARFFCVLAAARSQLQSPALQIRIGTAPASELHSAPLAAGGAKLTAASSKPQMEQATTKSMPRKVDQQGFPVLSGSGAKWWWGTGDGDGMERFTFAQCSMSRLADMLSFEYTRKTIPVEDKTGLTGVFDFHLVLPPPQPPAFVRDGPDDVAVTPAVSLSSLSRALEKQIGLRLNAAKINRVHGDRQRGASPYRQLRTRRLLMA
jgi:uncharacterized protein (TIGR03435 family)